MTLSFRDTKAMALAAEFGLDMEIHPTAGLSFVPAIRHDNTVYLSGQIPKNGATLVCVGAVGTEVTADQAKEAAKICTLRLLGVLISAYGSLDAIESVVQLNVFIQTGPSFDQQSEVADGASEVLTNVLQCEIGHARTAVGVMSLPKNASVEVNMTATLTKNWPAPLGCKT